MTKEEYRNLKVDDIIIWNVLQYHQDGEPSKEKPWCPLNTKFKVSRVFNLYSIEVTTLESFHTWGADIASSIGTSFTIPEKECIYFIKETALAVEDKVYPSRLELIINDS